MGHASASKTITMIQMIQHAKNVKLNIRRVQQEMYVSMLLTQMELYAVMDTIKVNHMKTAKLAQDFSILANQIVFVFKMP